MDNNFKTNNFNNNKIFYKINNTYSLFNNRYHLFNNLNNNNHNKILLKFINNKINKCINYLNNNMAICKIKEIFKINKN